MTTKNYSISLPIELADWYDENDYISLSKITQSALLNVKSQREEITKEEIKLIKANNSLKENLVKANQFITDKNMWEEFCNNESNRN